LAAELGLLNPNTLALIAAERAKSPPPVLRWGRVVNFDAIDPPVGHPNNWSFAAPLGDPPGMSLAGWLNLPPSAPRQMLLPGFSTTLERNVPGGSDLAPGMELFYPTMALQAVGVRTVLLSRWRTGGRTAAELMREMVQELPHVAPSEAWQRAVMVVQESRLDLASEPRVRWTVGDPPKANHPYLWAGYMLVDPGVSP
jgi:hypothetical protein